MKRKSLFALLLVTSLLMSAPALSAPDAASSTQPAVATKVAPKADTKTEPVVAPAVEKKAEETKTAAETQDTQKWWQGILVTVIEAVLAIVTPILSILIMLLVKKWKLKIEQDKVDWVLSKGLGAGEQYIKGKLKAGLPVEGPEVAKIALDLTNKLAVQYQLPSKLGNYFADLIEAKLGEAVIEAGGAKAVVANGAGSGG